MNASNGPREAAGLVCNVPHTMRPNAVLCFILVLMFGGAYCMDASAQGQLPHYAIHVVQELSFSERGTQQHNVLGEVDDLPPQLSQTISLRLDDVTVQEAIQHITQESGMRFIYGKHTLASTKRVTLYEEQVRIVDALRKVLDGTRLKLMVSSSGQIIVVDDAEAAAMEGQMPAPKVLQGAITGTVTDAESGETIPGVNVVVVGTQQGASTDVVGQYTISGVEPGTYALEASFVGYTSQTREGVEVEEGDTTTVSFALQPSTEALDELVVVGYGMQERAEVTGSVSSISSEELEDLPYASFEGALQGRLAGVNVATTDGAPGSAAQITIRGTGSITAGNEPLFVVDGVPLSQNLDQQDRIQQQRSSFPAPRSNPLATINPNNIESIEVLKDAAATAIYGSRGSNGVILITTKGGAFDVPPQINIRSYTGVQTVFNQPGLMNAEELIEATIEGRNNLYLRQRDPMNPDSDTYNPEYDPNTNAGREEFSNATGNMMIPDMYLNWDGTDTDWLDAVLERAVLHNTDFSVRGGGSDLAYYVGGGYMGQSGIVKGSGFERYSINTSLQGRLAERFQLDLKLNTAFTTHDRKPANGPYFGNPAGIIYSAMVASPVAGIYDDEGNYLQTGYGSINGINNGGTTSNHPIALRDYVDETLNNNRVFGSVAGTYSILDNLRFKSLLGFDVDSYQRKFYQGTQLRYRGSDSNNSYAQSSASQSFNWIWENTLDFNASFGAGDMHRINTVVGYTAQKQTSERNRVVARNFPDDNVQTVNGGIITGGTQNISEWSLVSALGRVNYVLLDRYLLTATVRSDRSSRFGRDNQTGIFPSVSLGWRLINEPFMENVNLFSEIKPRVSYGVTGNFSIPNYGAIGLISSTNYVRGDISSGSSPATLGNDNLTWETTREINVGLDVGILNDRIYGSFDYYVSNTTDLLLNVNIPSVTGFRNALTNIGEVQNRGLEIQLTSRNLTGAFHWATDVSFATNANEVKALGPEGDPILVEGAAGLRHITQVGSEIGSYWGYVHDGIYQSQEEIDNAPVDLEGDPTPGDIRWKDINGDGVIDPDDRTIIGSYHPDFQWGVTNQFNWKGFDMSIFIQGVYGREVLNLTGRHLLDEANFNLYSVLVDGRWRSPEEPGDGYYPKITRADPSNNSRPSSFLVEDASYIKIKNVQLGYSIPQNILDNFANRVRIYGTVTNLAMWTDYLGWNPEVNLHAGNALTPGEDYGAYPLFRAFQLGIDVSF